MDGVEVNTVDLQLKKGYEGGGRCQDLWWWQTASWEQLRATLKYILGAARARCYKYVRRGEGGGGS